MINKLKTSVKALLTLYPTWECRREYRSQAFTRFNERPVEFAFVFRQIAKLYPKTVLDVGTGTTALPHLVRNCGAIVTAADNVRDYWPAGMRNRHYHILDDDITRTKLTEKFDLITCISVLEHIVAHDEAMHNMFSLLKPGGHLVLTCPYTESSYIQNVYKLPASSYGQDAPYVCQSYSASELSKWIAGNNAAVVEQEYWQFWTGDYWTTGTQVIPPRFVERSDLHQLSCMLLRKSNQAQVPSN